MNPDGESREAGSPAQMQAGPPVPARPAGRRQTGESISIVRLQLIREGSLPYSRKPVRNSSDAARIFRSYLAGADREYFVALMLDAKHRVNALNVVAVGSLTASLVHPREVFKPAVAANAAALIAGHNHPSGDPSPSQEDIQLTQRLVKAGEVLGIKVLDHIIIGESALGGEYISFADRGLISPCGEER